MTLNSLGSLKAMMLIRAFETALASRLDHGFQLLSTGEEAVAVGLASALNDRDQLLTGGRSVGPALARGLKPGDARRRASIVAVLAAGIYPIRRPAFSVLMPWSLAISVSLRA
jgi:TPP-dependent pyruvate/acetoin dehydrogenase alpha subunit